MPTLDREYTKAISVLQKAAVTPLLRLENIESDYGIKNVFIKDESRNKYGTIKDRRNTQVITEARQLRVDKLVLVTTGNNGYGLARLAQGTGIKVVCIVHKNLPAHVAAGLREVCHQVIELNLDHRIIRTEEIIAFARERDDEVIWDVTHGFDGGYESVVNEILHKTQPDYVVVPLGTGEMFIGITDALSKYGSSAKVIGIGVQNTVQSFADKLCVPWTPYAKVLQERAEQGHSIYRICEDQIKKCHTNFKNLVRSEPSSTVVFAALAHYEFKPKDTVVFVNSGKMN